MSGPAAMPQDLGAGGELRPRFGRGLAVLPIDGGLVVEGAAQRRKLTGALAESILPALLPLLDGSLGRAELAGQSGLPPGQLDRVLTVLDDCDVLEWVGAKARGTPPLCDFVADYLSRIIGAAPGYGCVEDLAWALACSTVLIAGSGPIEEQVAADLAEVGVGDIRMRNGAAAISNADLSDLATAARALVVAGDAGGALAGAVALLPGCDVRVLRVAYDGAIAEVGPIFGGRWIPCVRCVTGSRPEPLGDGTRRGGEDLWPDSVAGIAAAEILAVLTRVTVPSPPWQVRRISAPGPRVDVFDAIANDDCDRCGSTGEPSWPEPVHALVAAYERQRERRTAVLDQARPLSPERQRAIAAMQGERNPMTPAPCHQLSPGFTPAGDAGPGSVPRQLDEPLIAGLLARTAGRVAPGAGKSAAGTADKNLFARRWAPSGGNLASTQIYVATAGDLFGLPGTIVKYDDIEHRVISLNADTVPLNELVAGTDLDTTGIDVVLFLVAEVGRLSRKYDDFALRLAHLDAGCACLQLSLVAGARGIDVSFASRWNRDLASRLELDNRAELITAVAGLAPGNVPPKGGTLCH